MSRSIRLILFRCLSEQVGLQTGVIGVLLGFGLHGFLLRKFCREDDVTEQPGMGDCCGLLLRFPRPAVERFKPYVLTVHMQYDRVVGAQFVFRQEFLQATKFPWWREAQQESIITVLSQCTDFTRGEPVVKLQRQPDDSRAQILARQVDAHRNRWRCRLVVVVVCQIVVLSFSHVSATLTCAYEPLVGTVPAR